MKSTNVRQIKQAIYEQAMSGRRQVRCEAGRVIDARWRKGQFQAKTLGLSKWYPVAFVTID